MKKILVIGDSCVDEFIYGQCVRLCPDAPVPILKPVEKKINGGMAKNVCCNIQSLGYHCDLICQPNEILKTRYVDIKTNHMFIRIDTGESDINRISNIHEIDLSSYEAIVVSDYNKGFLAEEDIQYLCEKHPLVFLDTKKHLNEFCKAAKFIKINEIEYNSSKQTIDNGNFFENLIVTLGEKGCRYKDVIFPVKAVQVKDMSGAGDTFMAGLVVRYIETEDIVESIKFANICSSQVVQKRGVNQIDLKEIQR